MAEETPKTPVKFNYGKLFTYLGKTVIVLYVVISGVLLYGLWTRLAKVEDRVFPKPAFSNSDITKVAKEMGLDTKKFQSCLSAKDVDTEITADYNSGRDAGIQGTPGSVLVDLSTNKAVRVNGGAMPYDALKTIIDQFVAGKSLEEINAPFLQGGQGTEIVTTLENFAPISDSDAVRGSKNAKFALIEYSDLECPYCIRFHPTVKDLLTTYKDDMQWVYRHFPLTSIHPNAQLFAQATECAKVQGGNDAFWTMTDTIFSSQGTN